MPTNVPSPTPAHVYLSPHVPWVDASDAISFYLPCHLILILILVHHLTSPLRAAGTDMLFSALLLLLLLSHQFPVVAAHRGRHCPAPAGSLRPVRDKQRPAPGARRWGRVRPDSPSSSSHSGGSHSSSKSFVVILFLLSWAALAAVCRSGPVCAAGPRADTPRGRRDADGPSGSRGPRQIGCDGCEVRGRAGRCWPGWRIGALMPSDAAQP